ncbi:MAG: peptide chain release factor N(5)-glutamine methyltransferase [Rhodoglobus sp.]
MGGTTITAVVGSSIAALEAAGIVDARVDVECLVGHVLGLSRGGVQAKMVTHSRLSADDAVTIEGLIRRRAGREPVQHITGRAAFRHRELAVGPGVFVPRPETELVAQFAIDALWATASSEPIGVDLGMGSGAIALAMATEVGHARIYGVEVSPQAFVWAQKNFRQADAPNATAILADLSEALPDLNGTVDVVISNPPYIPLGAVPRDPEVRLYDPGLALYGGRDGLDVVRRVSVTAHRLLHPGGTLVIEHGELQAESLAELLTADGWTAVAHHRDLLGRDRATTALR